MPKSLKYSHAQPLRIGAFLCPPVQLLDLAPVDLFHMLSKEYLSLIPMFPEFVKSQAITNVKIWYISENKTSSSSLAASSESDTGARVAPLTANAHLQMTASLESSEVQPGTLDILFIPGPDPSYIPNSAETSFIRSHFESGTCDVITVCTGIYPAAYSGILDGRTATGPRGVLPDLGKKFSAVKWVRRRWTTDAIPTINPSHKPARLEDGTRPTELWTSAEISNGHDVVAAYIKKHFERELADLICAMADVGERAQDYETGVVKEGGWWLWLFFRSWVGSLRRK